jgi:type IV pilus assembly protein PilB
VRLVNFILTDAINKGASDIHLEPYEKAFRIRFRLDGILYEMISPPLTLHVGEIRDVETAEIAIKAALTGHLVLSTVHTNDAISTVGRLISMGVPAYLVSASLNLLLAQRLVRRLCAECRAEVSVPVSTLTDIGFSPQEAKTVTCYRGKGCIACRDTGYRGRIGLYEVVLLNEQMREAILIGASVSELRMLQAKYGMRSLGESGLQKIREGVTTVEEVVRVTTFF